MIRVCKIMEFEAAHFIPGHKGKCKDLHGHSYKLEVVVQGEPDIENHITMDFSDLKDIMKEIVDDWFDHKMLNDKFIFSTAEYLVGFIGAAVAVKLPKGVLLCSVKLWETSTSWAEYIP
jgi:6-pyruvoyltetrahydropterin/6-carboxytetrahydropterin synthase